MADLTRTITVELTKTFRDVKEDYKTDKGENILLALRLALCGSYDQIKIAKIEDIVSKSKPKLTKMERAFCELITDGYIARGGDADLYWYETKPWKADGMWHCIDRIITLEVFDEITFMFIEWEDDEPWAVKDLLKLEVEE